MSLTQDNEVVHALAPDRPDQPFGESVLPRRGGCNGLVAYAHGLQSTCDDGPEDAIMITDEVARNASVIWRAIHSAVGCLVTSIQIRSLRSSRTMMKA